MGPPPSTSQSIENTFNMSAINESIYTEINKSATTTTASGTNIQDLTLNIMNLDGCSVQTGQKITAKTMSSSEFDDQKTTDIKNAITTETLNSTVAEQVNIQGQVLNVGNCVDSDISLNQDIVAEVAATSITKMVKTAIAGNTLLNTMAAKADSSATKKQGGLAGLMDSIFGGVAGIIGTSQQGAMAGSAASVCCVCVLMIGLVVMFLSPAGQNMGRQGMSKF